MAWFRKRTIEPPPPPPPTPSPSSSPQERYAGKPFLKLVDSFVLKCIGALDQPTEAALGQMTPKLRQTFNHTGTWEEIVMHQLGFDPTIRSAIRDLWERNQEIARQNGATLTPMQFTEMFVAKNVSNA
jgi:hypothetical protein